MDRPPNAKLRVLPRPSIPQNEILELIEIDNNIRRLRKRSEAISSDLLSRRMAGINVEPGLYRLDIEEEYRGDAVVQRLKIR